MSKDKHKAQSSHPSQPRILLATMLPIKQKSSSQVIPFPLPLQSGLTYNYGDYTKSPVLSRHFSIKWWDKFGVDRIIYQVNIEFPPLQMPVNPVKTTASPSSSNASLQGKSKKELKELAEQILAQVTQMNDEDSDDASPKSESSSSQKPSQPFSQKPKPRWSNYPDSQDPYDLNED
ncbi:hypothetical protein ACE6H2_015394 [Prunus campanulata]